MHRPLVKICGIRHAALAEEVAAAGVEFIGIVFHPASKRYVDIKPAKLIAAASIKNGAIPVAVFVDETASQMQAICAATHVQVVQLHGPTAKQQHHLLPAHYQRIYVHGNHDDLEHCDPKRDFLLFDNLEAGKGKPFNWKDFHYAGDFPWFLAGGLTAKNVGEAIRQMHPIGVDISSGVENEAGEKDISLIRKFIHACMQKG